MALLWTEKGLEVDRYCVGEDHPEYKTTSEAFTQFKVTLSKVSAFDGHMNEYLRNLGTAPNSLV
jgi:hypothetical protein